MKQFGTLNFALSKRVEWQWH